MPRSVDLATMGGNVSDDGSSRMPLSLDASKESVGFRHPPESPRCSARNPLSPWEGDPPKRMDPARFEGPNARRGKEHPPRRLTSFPDDPSPQRIPGSA